MPTALENKQQKTVSIVQFKALGEGAGGGMGYPSVFYDLDDVGDIALPGAYQEGLADFLRDGFIASAHEWDEAIGYPVVAREDAYGLWSEWAFHSTSDAQDVRQKAAERADAGKTVKLSIGYVTEASVEVTRDAYETELPKYIPADKLAAVLEKAQKFYCVRLLQKIKLYEYSIVTVPALDSAQATGIKSLAGGLADDLPFAEHLETVVDAVEGIKTRFKARGEMRKKAGRRHSADTLQRMGTIRDSLKSSCDDLTAMIAEVQAEETGEEPKSAPNIALLSQRLQAAERAAQRWQTAQ
jgi:HK97 family phage prohead protease